VFIDVFVVWVLTLGALFGGQPVDIEIEALEPSLTDTTTDRHWDGMPLEKGPLNDRLRR